MRICDEGWDIDTNCTELLDGYILYTWEDAKNICPEGWELPSKDDFDHLIAYAETHKTGRKAFYALISTAWGSARPQMI